MEYIYSDGGRAQAGFRGVTGDCVTRAIAIATGKPYREVYDEINDMCRMGASGRRPLGKSSARTGVPRWIYEHYLASLGWRWVATMGIGSGCQVHLRANELPGGRLIVRLSHHMVAVIDGVIYDAFDPSRDGTRCVYGYFTHPGP